MNIFRRTISRTIISHTTVLILVLTNLMACTSTRNYQESQLSEKLKLGETVTVFELDGRVSHLQITAIENGKLIGVYPESVGLQEIDIEAIERVEAERLDIPLTVLAGVGAVVGSVAIFAIGIVMLVAMI